MLITIAHGDQPERSSINGLLGGRSNHYKRFWLHLITKEKPMYSFHAKTPNNT